MRDFFLVIFILIASFTESTCQQPISGDSTLNGRSYKWDYKVLGFSFSEYSISDTAAFNLTDFELERNYSFHKLIRLSQKTTQVGFPFMGDFHFKDYKFTEAKEGIQKYNYFLFCADLFPSYYLFTGPQSKANLRVEFGLKLRVWNKRLHPLRTNYTWRPSHAIKTPSFLPGIYYSRILHHQKNSVQESYKFLEFGFAHHSNGQDSPTLVRQDSTLVLPEGQKYNIVDGDFSANNFSLKLGMIIHKHGQKAITQSIQFILDGLDSEKFDLEDLHKYNIKYSWSISKLGLDKSFGKRELENHRFNFHFRFGISSIDQIDIMKSLSYSISYHHRLAFSKDLFVFCRYDYLGQDDYNIYLENSLHFFRWGISTSAFN